MMERACVTCEFWDQRTSHKRARNAGLCRVNPPVKNGGDERDYGWPETFDEDWCGEWLAKEPSGN